MMSPERPSLRRILSDASLIISAHYLHFLALSILFIFPASFAGAIYNLLFFPNPLETLYLLFLTVFSAEDYRIPAIANSQILYQLLFSLISLFFTTCAASSIAASTFNGFYGMPVEFISALRSVLVSFLPLLATNLLIGIMIGLIVFASVGLMLFANSALASIGFDMDYYDQNEYNLVFYIAIAVVLAVLLIYLQIEWSLSSTVVVVESDWGFEALKRSSYLVKGARGVMFMFFLFFGVLAGILGICYLKFVLSAGGGGGSDEWNGWLLVKVIVFSCFSTILSLYSFAGITVFFIYCKALRLELEFETDGKLGGEYVRLPYDVNFV